MGMDMDGRGMAIMAFDITGIAAATPTTAITITAVAITAVDLEVVGEAVEEVADAAEEQEWGRKRAMKKCRKPNMLPLENWP